MFRHRVLILGLLALAGCATESTTRTSTPARVEAARPMIAAAPVTAGPIWPASAPQIHARYAIMIDARTGRTLYQKNADVHSQVASTQKLMTALVLLQRGDLAGTLTIAREDTLVEPGKLNVRAGQTYSRVALLSAMIVKSENDAAAALARDHAGSIPAFAAEMNQVAREIGANNSYFVNPHGLPASQFSTARDMAIIAFHAYREPILRRLMATKYYTFLYADGRTRQLENTNKLLGRSMICNGMKTGFTNAAGRCLVSSATNGSRDVILVQLGSKTNYIFDDAETMMQWGLNSASPFSLASY
ncbi:D-alanyl-D-alanine carboxypeptidase [Terrimicrobium sacchariphilum]|jgi:D-alanyl-D-alanine carboxypeptidase (penicillin-binding protein 5/6)|uniref:D-alanyl-D-alanine carboxypeptidase n=1 Tax=Terrimicrobium sacchariphilum TaxID=690879 RepID=A0A146G9G6_TERSA|nr:serine hydrolase [Terrimicrobium sacchariphilum]GAT33477.1 D-alanyl-D-alanine carboxypeptidase [Terrimicrobium sacchariphilum]